MSQTICICGAGTMGSGIAQVFAQSGFHTLLFDVNAAMLTNSRILIEDNLALQVNRGKLTNTLKTSALSRLRFTENMADCVADIVIEAIIEKLQPKIKLLHALEAINTLETIFATNTSSIPVSAIAAPLLHSARVIGMHFFNPAPIMKLVEIVRGDQTSEEVVDRICKLTAAINKTPVVCNDAPGFIVNRVARPYYLQALKLVSEGHTNIETVDQVMEATGFKMGPFRLMDLIGMDVNYQVSHTVWQALGEPDRLKPSALQKETLDAGNLGKKTGKGFYTYHKS